MILKLKKKIEKLKTAVAPVLAAIVPVWAMHCASCGQVIEPDASEKSYEE